MREGWLTKWAGGLDCEALALGGDVPTYTPRLRTCKRWEDRARGGRWPLMQLAGFMADRGRWEEGKVGWGGGVSGAVEE